MIIIDDRGTIRFANRQVSALFGYSHDAIIGLPVEQLMPERFRRRHVDHRRDFAAALRPRAMGEGLTLFGRRLDGSEFPVEIGLSPIRTPPQLLIAAAIRDISDRKRAEAELRVAREASDRANQAKSRFLAMASHDLRQPLQTLALLNGILRRLVKEPSALDALVQQDQAIGAMTRLLSALLDISKLESGAIQPQLTDFRIATLFEGLRHEFASIAASKSLELQLAPCAEYVHSDSALVEQILKNLLSNAIKYTAAGGSVSLRARRDANTVRVDVTDTGVGIASDQLAYIYDEFYQIGVPANSSREGYGLGLSIVQRLVRLLNLRLEVTSEVGKGSVFSLLLPRGSSRQETAQPPAVAAGAARESPLARRPRVLLVEDDPGVRDATRMLLNVEGYQVRAVASGDEALRNAHEEGAPDLLITDYHLGAGELGTELIATLRDKLHAQVRAVLVTGDTSDVINHIPNDPRLRIASKPIDAEQLLSMLKDLLTD